MTSTRRLAVLIAIAALGAAWACGRATPGRYTDDDAKKAVTDVADLQITELQPGTGAAAARGRVVRVHYTGWLFHPDKAEQKGRQFDSSRDRGEPFQFTLGRGDVIRGWDEGVEGLQVGGRRRLVIPPSKGYGSRGAGESIPPDATLVFDVELIEVR